MIKQSLRKAAKAVAPRYVLARYLHHKINWQARSLSRLRDASESPTDWADSLWGSDFFRPMQKRSEILRLVALLKSRRPSTICEIGAARCGTTFLLAYAAAADATIITLDLDFTASRMAAVRHFATDKQRIICLPKNSHERETLEAVTACLQGRSLDVLYIDGDHSYAGIKADFRLYSPLVRPGGIIIFHDIVPDYKTRFGVETASCVGGVPQFWEEIKAARRGVEEIVEDYAQDGFGIGLLHWSGSVFGEEI